MNILCDVLFHFHSYDEPIDGDFVNPVILLQKEYQRLSEKLVSENDEIFESIQQPDLIIYRRKLPNNRLALCKYLRKRSDFLSFVGAEWKNDRFLVSVAVTESGRSLEHASEELKADPEIVYLAAYNNSQALKYAHPNLLKDRDFMMRIILRNGSSVFEYASEELKNDDEIVRKAMEINVYGVQYLPERFRNDKNFVLEAISKNANCIQYIGETLKHDRELYLKAAIGGGLGSGYSIPEDLKTDVEFMRVAIKGSSQMFALAPDSLKKDKKLAIELVKRNDFELKNLSSDLLNDRDVALAILYSQNYRAVENLGESLRKDKEIIKIALAECSAYNVLPFIDQELLLDKEFCMEILELDQSAMRYIVNTELLNDKELFLKLIEIDPMALSYAGQDLKNDRECVLKSLEYGGEVLDFLSSDELLNDRYIAMKSLTQYGGNINSLIEEFQNDRDMVLKAARFRLDNIPEKFENDREILEKAFNYYGNLEIPASMLKERKYYLAQVKKYRFDLYSSGKETKRDRELVLEYSKYATPKPTTIPDFFCDDREIVYECVKRNGKLFYMASNRLRRDKAIAFLSLKGSYLSIPPELRDDKEFMLEGIKKISYFRHGSIGWDREFALKAAICGTVLTGFEKDREIVLLAAKKDGFSTIFQSDVSFRSDREFMFIVITNSPHIFDLASEELRDDAEFVFKALISNEERVSNILPFISDRLRNDFEFVQQISTYIDNIAWIPENIRNNYGIASNALGRNGLNLRHLSPDLRNDKQLVMTAVKQNGDAIKFASKSLQQDRQVISEAIPTCTSFYFLSNDVRMDREFILEHIGKNGDLLRAVPHLQSDKEVVLRAVMNKGIALEVASDELKIDRQVVLAAVTNSGKALNAVDEELRNDKEIALAATTSYTESILLISYELRTDRQFILEAVSKNPKLFEHIDSRFQNDEEITKVAVDLDVNSIHHASYRLKHNVEFLHKLNQRDNILINNHEDLWYVIDMQGLKNFLKQHDHDNLME